MSPLMGSNWTCQWQHRPRPNTYRQRITVTGVEVLSKVSSKCSSLQHGPGRVSEHFEADFDLHCRYHQYNFLWSIKAIEAWQNKEGQLILVLHAAAMTAIYDWEWEQNRNAQDEDVPKKGPQFSPQYWESQTENYTGLSIEIPRCNEAYPIVRPRTSQLFSLFFLTFCERGMRGHFVLETKCSPMTPTIIKIWATQVENSMLSQSRLNLCKHYPKGENIRTCLRLKT